MFYPVYLNIQNRKCLVVGGGTVAERKVVSMLLSGGDVTFISPDATDLLAFLAQRSQISWHKRQLQSGDTNGYFLVSAATDSTAINTAAFREAYEVNKIRLVNVVDVIPQCTFAAASVVTDGELMISISTSGKSPATSRRIREYLEEVLKTTSLYTLGYDANGKPMPIENQQLPYPVYLLLENRLCVVLSSTNDMDSLPTTSQKTSALEDRVSLLRQCGAKVLDNPPHFDDAFLVISESEIPDTSDMPLREQLDNRDAGTFFTPHLIIDDNLIISIATRNGASASKAKQLHQVLTEQFENSGYGAFVSFLGTLRPAVLRTFPTSKMRGDFFETLIGHVTTGTSPRTTCCLGFGNPACAAECLFNWVRHGKLEHANTFASELLANKHSTT